MKIITLLFIAATVLASCRKASLSNPNENALQVPTAFTPTDSVNNRFIVTGSNIISYSIKIYDSKNNLVYQSDNINQSWDGTYKGNNEPAGSYLWVITYTSTDGENAKLSGYVEIIR